MSGWMSKIFKIMLSELEKTFKGQFLCFISKKKTVSKNRIFRAPSWPSSVGDWQVMAQNDTVIN